MAALGNANGEAPGGVLTSGRVTGEETASRAPMNRNSLPKENCSFAVDERSELRLGPFVVDCCTNEPRLRSLGKQERIAVSLAAPAAEMPWEARHEHRLL